jgi:hypothetical protein
VHIVAVSITRIDAFINSAKFIKLMKHGLETILELTKHYRRGGGSTIPKGYFCFLLAFLLFGFTRASAQITLTQSSATSCYNTSVVFTATLTPDPVLGSVDLYDGATKIASVSLNNGTAVFNINNLTTGSHTIKATYLVALSNTLTESNPITHVVNPPIDPGTIDLTGGTYCSSGDPGTIGSISPANGGSGTLIYAWQSSTDCNTWSGFISGATEASYSPGAITQTTCYRRSVTDECGNIAYTSPVQFTVYPQLQPQNILPNISSGAVCAGLNLSASFSGGSTGIPGRTDFTDVYQYSTDGGVTWSNYTPNNPIATTGLSGTDVVKIRTRREPQYTDLGCAVTQWNEMSWTVNPLPTLSGSLAYARTNSSSFTYVPASDVSGTQFSWSRGLVAGISNPAATGTGSISETLINTTRTAIDVTYQYTLNAGGCTNTQSIVLRINGMLAIAYDVTGGGSYCQGGGGVPVGLSNSETGVTYQLIRDGVDVAGATVTGTGSAISFGNQTVAGTYTVRATDANGSNMMTGSVTVTVNQPVSITSQPQGITSAIGCSASFSVAATGTPSPTYQWRKNGVDISGATNATYTISSIASGDAGNYDVVVTNACGSVPSSAAVLTVNAALSAGSHNTTTIDACIGYNAPSLNVSGTTGGLVPYSYQWKLNGADISGANSSGYTPGVIPSTGTYIYNVQITDACNQVVSTATKTINIVADPIVTASGGGAICQNSSPSLSASLTGGTGTMNYQWQSSPTGAAGTWVDISSAVSSTYSPSTSTTGTFFYRVTLSPNVASCNNSSSTITLTVNALPTASISGATAVCQSTTQPNVTFTGANGSAPYTFTYTINGGANQTVTTTSGNSVTVPVPTGTAGTFTYALVSVSDANNCSQTQNGSVDITVHPTPTVTATPGSQTICSGTAPAIALTGTVPGTSFAWTVVQTGVSGASAGTGTSIAQNLTATGTTAGSAVYTITPTANGCNGNPITVTITVNPTPVATATPSSTAICSGDATSIALSSNVATTSFAWTVSSQTGASGASAGSGNTIAQTLTASSITAGTVVYSVVPTANGCQGSPVSVTVTVNPIPDVNEPSNQMVCNGAQTSAINFTSFVSGTTFNWTNNTTSIGLAASGSGNIPAFTAVNTGNSQVTATITVTPTANGCSGIPYSFTIRVNPTPAVNAVSNVNYCHNTAGAAINFGSNVTGTSFAWTSSANVGFGTSGSGNIPAFTATNSGTAPVTATVSVTPTANGCTGPVTTFTVTVNPIPVLSSSSTPGAVCSGAAFTYIPASATAGASFSWSRGAVAGISNAAASGTGSINETLINTTANPVTVNYAYTISANGCSNTQNVAVTINPVATIASQATTICSGAGFSVTPASGGGNTIPAGTTYAWTAPAVTGGLTGGAAGSGSSITGILTNPTTSAQTATYTVTPTSGSCQGAPFTVTVTVNPRPTVSDQTAAICSGTAFTVSPAGVPAGTTYTWTTPVSNPAGAITGGSAQATGQASISQTLTNTTNAPATLTYTVTPLSGTCAGSSFSVTVTVNPRPTVTAVSNQTFCNGVAAPATTLAGPVSGTTFSWTNSNTAIGLAAGGTGNVPAFTASNATTSPISATITITPTANGCAGTPSTYTITVNPTPTVTKPADQTLCNGTSTTAVSFTGTVTGTTYSWTNNTPSIGLAASGSGNIPAFTAVNTGTAPVTATISVTPTANGCAGTTQTFTITVNPSPTVNPIGNLTYCNTASGAAINFGSATTGASFAWTSSANVGFGTSGSGNIPAFTATNSGTTAITATVSVTATANGCTGVVRTFTITVNPTPTVTNQATTTICSGTGTNINLTANIASSFSWTIGTVTGGITGATAGSGTTINQTLTNSGSTAGTVQYIITPTSTSGSCPGTPYTITVTVNPKPVGSATAQSLCSGTAGSVALNSTVAGTTFTWTAAIQTSPSGGTVTGFSNCTSSCGSSINQTLTNSGTTNGVVRYTVTPTANGCAGTPFTVDVTVYPRPNVIATPASQTVCTGSTTNIALTGSVSGTTYAWTVSQSGVSGASAGSGNSIAQTLTASSSAGGTATYTITPTANGCAGTPVTVTVTVSTPPTVTLNPSDNTVCANNASAIFQATVSGSPAPAIQWQMSSNNGTTWTNISGATSPTYNYNPSPSDPDGLLFRVVYTNSCGTATSAAAVLHIGKGVNFPNNDANGYRCQGGTSAQFYVKGTGGAGLSGTLTAHWQYSVDGNPPWIDIASPVFTSNNGNVEATYTATGAQLGYYFRLAVNNNGCVSYSPPGRVITNPTPVTTANPDRVYCHGQPISIALSGTNVTSWQWTNSNPAIGIPASGTNNPITGTATNTGTSPISGTVIVTPIFTQGGVSCPGTPDTFLVTVNPLPPCSITGPNNVCPGTTNTYTTTAGMSTYSWSISGNGTISGSATGQNVSVVAGATCGSYTLTVTITNSNGCSSTCSQTFTITDTINPVITLTPSTALGCNPTPAQVATAFGAATVTDNCSNGLTATGIIAPEVVSGCQVSVTKDWTVADACGNISTASQTVTFTRDNTPPTLTCPTVPPICIVPGNNYTIPPLAASDNCSANSALTITYSITGATTRSGTGLDASGIFNVGVSTITWTVVDECGNTNTCTTQVTIIPKPVPTIYHN